MSWWKFSQAEKRSAGYRRYLADGISRSLVAARAREISTRTGGYIGLRLLFDMVRPNVDVDRVLCGPTSKVWIDPWRRYLEDLGVRFHLGSEVAGIDVTGHHVTGVRLTGQAGPDPRRLLRRRPARRSHVPAAHS